MSIGNKVVVLLVFLGMFAGAALLFSESKEDGLAIDETAEESDVSIKERLLDIENRLVSFEDSLNIILVAKSNPQDFSDSSIVRGGEVYRDNCVMCHGSGGRGGGPLSRAIPNIPDLTGAGVQGRSDRELFNIITDGKAPMPAFNSIDKQDRWNLVNFIRSLGSVTK